MKDMNPPKEIELTLSQQIAEKTYGQGTNNLAIWYDGYKSAINDLRLQLRQLNAQKETQTQSCPVIQSV